MKIVVTHSRVVHKKQEKAFKWAVSAIRKKKSCASGIFHTASRRLVIKFAFFAEIDSQLLQGNLQPCRKVIVHPVSTFGNEVTRKSERREGICGDVVIS